MKILGWIKPETSKKTYTKQQDPKKQNGQSQDSYKYKKAEKEAMSKAQASSSLLPIQKDIFLSFETNMNITSDIVVIKVSIADIAAAIP